MVPLFATSLSLACLLPLCLLDPALRAPCPPSLFFLVPNQRCCDLLPVVESELEDTGLKNLRLEICNSTLTTPRQDDPRYQYAIALAGWDRQVMDTTIPLYSVSAPMPCNVVCNEIQ
ncbi:hypothetical protein R3P38DRAFT_3354907 [Favolaschia claudopus]|uniref:Uncharacterized protein n=1 Tax=Favolaschia claudopus TaxID=2862362 RepID=A0AAW0BL58_9AGAR